MEIWQKLNTNQYWKISIAEYLERSIILLDLKINILYKHGIYF